MEGSRPRDPLHPDATVCAKGYERSFEFGTSMDDSNTSERCFEYASSLGGAQERGAVHQWLQSAIVGSSWPTIALLPELAAIWLTGSYKDYAPAEHVSGQRSLARRGLANCTALYTKKF